MDLGPYPITALAFCGIFECKENYNRFICNVDDYVKGYKIGDGDFPLCALITDAKFRYNSSNFFMQVAPYSSNNEYGVISGDGYCIFKIIERGKNLFHLVWNGQTYSITMEKKFNNFKLIINQNNIVYIDRLVYHHHYQKSIINFPSNSEIQVDNLISILDSCISDLNNVLHGFVLPEPFFSTNISKQFHKMFKILRDPLLPVLHFRTYLDGSGSLLNNYLVSDLNQVLGQYTSNFSSLFSRFPSNKIKSLIEKYIESIEDNCIRLNMAVTLRPMLELTEMYSDGIRGNAKYVLDKLLREYLKVEIKFQNEDIINSTHMVNKEIVISDVISHNVLAEKNKLVLTLLEFLERFLSGIILDLKSTITDLLTSLSGNGYSPLISKLREILVTGQIPSYEVRKNEMEAIFLNSITGSSNGVQTNRIENLICSNSEVFDIISDFFYHKIIAIRKSAMEVYVRRAYMVYDICSFEQSQLSGGQLCVIFKFSLPTNNRRRNLIGHELKRSNSYVALMNGKTVFMRKFSQTSRNRFSNASIEKEYISDGELSNEDYFQIDQCAQKQIDYDTDSAISVGASSQSEHVDSDCIQENSCIKWEVSPSIYSLDKLADSFTYSSVKDKPENIEMSNNSLDEHISSGHNRHSSMICNNYSTSSGQDNLGLMIIFETLEEMEINFKSIEELVLCRNSATYDMGFQEYIISPFNADFSQPYKVVLKLILRDPQLKNKCDDDVAIRLLSLCDNYATFTERIHLIRITFLLQSTDKTIRYFTFRRKGNFEEDMKLRNIDPILSFQLEINRLRNYVLERLPLPNRRMYVYMGVCKERTTAVTFEYRMFARCIIHHKDFHSPTSNIDYMAKEAEKNLIEAMDALDMASTDVRAALTNANHIFFYFHSILCINRIEELENVVRAIIFKHGRRLWSLRITQAELKMSVKVNNGAPIPIRLWVHNEGGKSLDICIYREEFQFKADYKVLVSWSSCKDGRYHGVPVDCFYSL